MTFHIHFGVVPKRPFYAAEIDVPGLGYCSALAGDIAFEIGGYTAYLEGSWHQWGPDGYEDERSLHIIIEVDHLPSAYEYVVMRDYLTRALHSESRLIDHALITTKADWADVRAIVTYMSSPEVVVFDADRLSAPESGRWL